MSKPFGGVPIGVKELTPVTGWPHTEASLVFKDRVAEFTATMIERLAGLGGAVPFGLTTASEFGGINLTYTKLNGATRNPWNAAHTPGGSSGGAASAVAGGLCTIATGGDGGGSIRIPAGFTGLLGLKHTYGRIPKGPEMVLASITAVSGCLARSARDAARFLDVTNGFDGRDPYSLPHASRVTKAGSTRTAAICAAAALRSRRRSAARSCTLSSTTRCAVTASCWRRMRGSTSWRST